MNQINTDYPRGEKEDRAKVTYMVTLCTGSQGGKGMPKVDVFITLTGEWFTVCHAHNLSTWHTMASNYQFITILDKYL